jgi:PST family polysaccharide transporter
MAQFGRDPARLNGIASNAVRYLGLMILPVNIGIAILSGPFIRMLYGTKYVEAIPLMALASLLAIPKALLSPLGSLMGATDNQHIVVRWTIGVAILNVALDFWLIRAHAAMGAVIANGVAQMVMAGVIFLEAARLLRIRLPIVPLIKLTASAAVMAAAIWILPMKGWAPLSAILTGIGAGTAIFLLMLRITASIEPQDLERFRLIHKRLPSGLGACLDRAAALLVPAPVDGSASALSGR